MYCFALGGHMNNVTGKVSISILIMACAGLLGCQGGSSDDSSSSNIPEMVGSEFLKNASIIDHSSSFDRFSVIGENGYRYDTPGCRIGGISNKRDIWIYDNGFILSQYYGIQQDDDTICNVTAVYKMIDVKDSSNLNIPYMGSLARNMFYDTDTKYIYEVLLPYYAINDEAPILVEILNGGMTAKIKYKDADGYKYEDVPLGSVYIKINPSEIGMVLHKPNNSFYNGHPNDLIEVGYGYLQYGKQYTFSGYLFKYKDNGCTQADMHYAIYNDGSIFIKQFRNGREASCKINKFYEEIERKNGDVYALHVNGELYYDSLNQVYYEISHSQPNSYISEIINDGLSAIVVDELGVRHTVFITSSYKEVFLN